MPSAQTWVDYDLDDLSDDELIDELESRDYRVLHKDEVPDVEEILYKIRQEYILCGPEEFRKFIEKFLDEEGLSV
jgi:hypothetical protein